MKHGVFVIGVLFISIKNQGGSNCEVHSTGEVMFNVFKLYFFLQKNSHGFFWYLRNLIFPTRD